MRLMAASFYENFVVSKDGSVESLSSYEARTKPKKTRSRGPALVFAFTDVERQKLEQEKASFTEYNKSVMAKAFSKFTALSYLKSMRLSGGTTAENRHQPELMRFGNIQPLDPIASHSPAISMSKVLRARSFPTAPAPRSALRDRQEEETRSCLRSKQHVKWASDVQESISRNNLNTVNRAGQLILSAQKPFFKQQ